MTERQDKKTLFWSLPTSLNKSHPAIGEAADFLQKQEVVAFPTETVYGLGADATNELAVQKIFEAKGRPSDNPLIVHVAHTEQIEQLVTEIKPVAAKLIEAFLPGPLTLIFESNGSCAQNVTAGLSTVAIRIPDHPVAKALLEESQLPLAAPSANRSGRPSPTTAQHVQSDLDGRIAGILDGGPTGVGVESTVLDCTTEIPVMLRPGGVTQEEIEAVIGAIQVDPALKDTNEKPKSPGMKYTHYAPEAPLWLIDGSVEFFNQNIKTLTSAGKVVGVLGSDELLAEVKIDTTISKSIGSVKELNQIAANLYDGLRFFNDQTVDIILVESFPEKGVGQAIMNRLEKAASKIISKK